MSYFGLIVSLVQWFWEAALSFNATPEGHSALVQIANEAEALGIDVPFFEPTQEGEPLDLGDVRAEDVEAVYDRARRFRDKHPELFANEGGKSQ